MAGVEWKCVQAEGNGQPGKWVASGQYYWLFVESLAAKFRWRFVWDRGNISVKCNRWCNSLEEAQHKCEKYYNKVSRSSKICVGGAGS